MIQSLIKYILIIALFGFTLMWLYSYHYHQTIGIDHDVLVENTAPVQVERWYYRLWWPGNGSLLIGYSVKREPLYNNPTYEALDLAASFMKPPTKKPTPKSQWNQWGFWWIKQPAPIKQRWFGMPSALPSILIFFILLTVYRKNSF